LTLKYDLERNAPKKVSARKRGPILRLALPLPALAACESIKNGKLPFCNGQRCQHVDDKMRPRSQNRSAVHAIEAKAVSRINPAVCLGLSQEGNQDLLKLSDD